MSKKAALGFAVCVSVAWSTTLLCLLLSGFSFVFFFFLIHIQKDWHLRE